MTKTLKSLNPEPLLNRRVMLMGAVAATAGVAITIAAACRAEQERDAEQRGRLLEQIHVYLPPLTGALIVPPEARDLDELFLT